MDGLMDGWMGGWHTQIGCGDFFLLPLPSQGTGGGLRRQCFPSRGFLAAPLAAQLHGGQSLRLHWGRRRRGVSRKP